MFLFFLYRVWKLPVAVLAAAATGLSAAIYDQVVYYSSYEWMSFRLPQILITVASTTIIAGFGTPALTKALAATGVLDRFAAGRARELV